MSAVPIAVAGSGSGYGGSKVRACVLSALRTGTALEATFSPPGLRLDRCNQRSGPHDVDDAREIVGESVERHLGGHAW